MRVRKRHLWQPIHSKELFDKAAKLGKTSEDAYNLGGWLILLDLLNEWVAECVASYPHNFIQQLGCAS